MLGSSGDEATVASPRRSRGQCVGSDRSAGGAGREGRGNSVETVRISSSEAAARAGGDMGQGVHRCGCRHRTAGLAGAGEGRRMPAFRLPGWLVELDQTPSSARLLTATPVGWRDGRVTAGFAPGAAPPVGWDDRVSCRGGTAGDFRPDAPVAGAESCGRGHKIAVIWLTGTRLRACCGAGRKVTVDLRRSINDPAVIIPLSA